MESLLEHISDLRYQLKLFLQEQARQKQNNSAPLILRMACQRELLVEDRHGQQWAVHELYLSAFRHIYSNEAYKIVRLLGWNVELKFIGKKCTKLEIVSANAQFYSRSESKRISACHFKFTLAETPEDFAQFDQQTNGYLNRIGKRELCSVSQNIHREMRSLIKFAPLKVKPPPPSFDYQPWKKEEKEVHALNALTPAGLEMLQKVRHFVKIDQLVEFTKKHNLSGECASNLRSLIEKAHVKNEEQ